MKEEFIPYEQALALKELGFDEPCIAFYKDSNYLKSVDQRWGSNLRGISKSLGYEIDDLVLAPTFSQAFRWFREKHFKMAYIYYDVEYKFCFCIGYNDKTKGFKSYEEAELECLKQLIEIAKNDNTSKF